MIRFQCANFDMPKFIQDTFEGRKGALSDEVPPTIEFLILDSDWDIQEESEDDNRNVLTEISELKTIFIPYAGPFVEDTEAVNGKVYNVEENDDITLGDTEIVGLICKKVGVDYIFEPDTYFLGMCGHGPQVSSTTPEVLNLFGDDLQEYLNLFAK